MKNYFIFDLDGTIVDTQLQFHASIESQILRRYHDVHISPRELSFRFAGIPTENVFKELAPMCDTEKLVKEKWDMMYYEVKNRNIECLPEMYELILQLSELGNTLAVASASPIDWIKLCLENAMPSDGSFRQQKLSNIFGDLCFSAEDCLNPKPFPDVFLKAYSEMRGDNLGISIEDLLGSTYVIGDGRSDVIAGIAAKMPVLYLSTNNEEFDNNQLVKRFTSSKDLTDHIRQNIIR